MEPHSIEPPSVKMSQCSGAEQSGDANALTVLLLGKDRHSKNVIENFILTQLSETTKSENGEGEISGKKVNIVRVPEIFEGSADVPKDKLMDYQSQWVFFLVIQNPQLSEEEIAMFHKMKNCSSITSVNQWEENAVVVLVNHEASKMTFEEAEKNLRTVVSEFGWSYYNFYTEMEGTEVWNHLMERWTNWPKKQAYASDGIYEVVYEYCPITPNLEENIKQDQRKEQMQATDVSASNINTMILVLLGQTGSGKSASANTILRKKRFESVASSVPVTIACQMDEAKICGINVKVIDTPDFFNEDLQDQREQIEKCKELTLQGPAVYLLVMQLGRFTDGERQIVSRLQETFGQEMVNSTIILFTHKEALKNSTLDEYRQKTDPHLKKLIEDCGSRCHAFNNNDKNPQQVAKLIETILEMQGQNIDIKKMYPGYTKADIRDCILL